MGELAHRTPHRTPHNNSEIVSERHWYLQPNGKCARRTRMVLCIRCYKWRLSNEYTYFECIVKRVLAKLRSFSLPSSIFLFLSQFGVCARFYFPVHFTIVLVFCISIFFSGIVTFRSLFLIFIHFENERFLHMIERWNPKQKKETKKWCSYNRRREISRTNEWMERKRKHKKNAKLR